MNKNDIKNFKFNFQYKTEDELKSMTGEALETELAASTEYYKSLKKVYKPLLTILQHPNGEYLNPFTVQSEMNKILRYKDLIQTIPQLLESKLSYEDYKLLTEYEYMSQWKHSTDAKKLIRYAKINPNFDKFELLFHFGSSSYNKDNPENIKAILESNLFTNEELFEAFSNNRKWLSRELEEGLAKRMAGFKPWAKLTDPEQIFFFKNPFAKDPAETKEKFQFFEKKPKIYAKLIRCASPEYFLTNYTDEELQNAPDSLVSYISEDLDNTMKKIDYAQQYDFPAEILRDKKLTLFECCLLSPETSSKTLTSLVTTKAITLKDLEENFSENEIKTLPTLIQEVLHNPDSVWKLHTVPETIIHNIPKGQEWQVLEYFAETNPKLMVRLINDPIARGLISPKEFYEHYSSANAEDLPEAIVNHLNHLNKLKEERITRDTQRKKYEKEFLVKMVGAIEEASEHKTAPEYIENWYGSNAGLKEFFKLSADVPIVSKDDYIKIAEHFKNSGLNAGQFCARYKIEDQAGFRTMLKCYAEENEEFAEFYNAYKEQQKTAFITNVQNAVIYGASGDIEIPTIIHEHTSNRNLYELIRKSEQLGIDKNIIKDFAEQVVNYYHSRANSYTDVSSNVENINRMFSFRELAFILDEDSAKSLKLGKTINFTAALTSDISPVWNLMSAKSKQQINGKKTGLRERLKPYSAKFSRSECLNSHSQIILSDDEIVTITDDMIDMATCYAQTHKLYKCDRLMANILKAIAEGTIQNQAETEEFKSRAKQKLKNTLQEVKTLEEYLNALGSAKTMQ